MEIVARDGKSSEIAILTQPKGDLPDFPGKGPFPVLFALKSGENGQKWGFGKKKPICCPPNGGFGAANSKWAMFDTTTVSGALSTT